MHGEKEAHLVGSRAHLVVSRGALHFKPPRRFVLMFKRGLHVLVVLGRVVSCIALKNQS